MSDIDANVPSYIGRLECGCIVAAVVDDPGHEKETRRFFKEMIDDGLIIERVTVGWVREHGFEKCKFHLDQENQMKLPLEIPEGATR